MLILMQPDLEAAVSFYEALGLKKKFHMKEKWAEFDLQGINLGLCPISNTDLPDRRTGFVLEVEDLRKFYENQADQMTFLAEPVEAVHGIMVSFRDPGGNIIDLYQPTPEKVRELAKKAAEKKASCQEDDCCDDEQMDDDCCSDCCCGDSSEE